MADGSEIETEIIGLLQSKRYDPAILPRLEEYVDYQVSTRFCDADTNLAVLKLYQFSPDRYNPGVVAKILIKALMALPATDFLCALYLIPERRQVDEPIPVITQLAAFLETGQFKEFWEASGACADLLASVPGSLDAVRVFMLSVIARTYKTIDKPVLAQLVHLDKDDLELSRVIASNGWKEDDKGVIVIPPNDENQPRPPAVHEQLSFRQVAARML
jgi:translation initiation factor 3 subunit K